MTTTSDPATDSIKPFVDLSSRETSRRTLRTLLKTLLVLFGLWIAVNEASPLPDFLQAASDQDMKSLPQHRFWMGIVVTLAQLAALVAGIYCLWKYKSEGAVWLAIAAYAPVFIAFPMATVEPAAADYIASIGSVVIGMILFLCWTRPDIFEADADTDADAAPAPPTNKPSVSSP
jgi:hypothetical protein